MTQYRIPKMLTATALGALAVSLSAPAMAQETTSPAATPPVATTTPPPPVTVQSEAPAAQPGAAPTTTYDLNPSAAPAATSAPASAAATKPTTPATTASTATTTRTATRSTAVTRSTPAKAAPRTEAPVARTAAGTAQAKASPDVTAPAPVVTEPQPASAVTPVATGEVAQSTANPNDNEFWLEVGGGVGIALLGAIGVGALAMRGRRREVIDEPFVPATEHVVDNDVAMAPMPVAAAPAMAAPVPIRPAATATTGDAYVNADGRTVGRFEAAAEHGPTPDNPFLTRRARVRRARFYDRRERLARGEGQMPAAPIAQPSIAPRPAPQEQVTYVFGKGGAPKPGLIPTLRRS